MQVKATKSTENIGTYGGLNFISEKLNGLELNIGKAKRSEIKAEFFCYFQEKEKRIKKRDGI